MKNNSEKPLQENQFSIDYEKFMSTDRVENSKRKQAGKKYNIKIKKSDLILLDELAEVIEVPRSVLLNTILHDILRISLTEEIKDGDTKVLIAREADKIADYDHTAWPWIFDIMPNECVALMDNLEKYNYAVVDFQEDPYSKGHSYNSESFNSVKNAIKEHQQ